MTMRSTLAGAGLAGVILCAACGSATSHPGPNDQGAANKAIPSSSTTAKPSVGIALGSPAWTNSSIHAVTGLRTLGDRFLVYGSSGGKLTLYGLDPATGTVVWQQAATPSGSTPGVALKVATVGNTVVYLRPDPARHLTAHLVAADPATGKDRWVSPTEVFTTTPGDCGDSATICVNVADSTNGEVATAYSAADGTSGPAPGVPKGARPLGANIYDLGTRSPEQLGVVGNGTLAWSKPLDTFFGAGYSTDGGWDFELYKTAGMYVGSVGLAQSGSQPPLPVTLDLSKTGTAGITSADGTMQWFVPHTAMGCEGTLDIFPGWGDDVAPLPVRCLYLGKATADKTGVVAVAATVQVQGFDVNTGTRTWSWDAGHARQLVDAQKPLLLIDDFSVVLPDLTGKQFVVDLRTGVSRPVGPTTIGWCPTSPTYHYNDPVDQAGTPVFDRVGGPLVSPCHVDGSSAPAGSHVPDVYGVSAKGSIAYATAHGVVAFHQA